VVLLNQKNEVLESPTVSVGTLSASLVHPREVFKPAVRASAASVILAHNHPSGNTEPSAEDREVTRRISEAARILGIEVLDHVILGDGYFSMKESSLL
jgi:DNA repair protein RadC